ncbi:type VI secretion system baseplate subunit TssF [Noviherbaspirillum aerium]|uniref:type VI secretion system baseplate subunit TssF n=1 Tax=Noviherbaspirillum aerium TaxID=2588497 RepID=UPI00124E3DA0|nr:type VI secretion system baseplate subunit TssF [Noviherbaspirillum aerium]
MEELLPYYERELTFLRRTSREFAERYPKVAGRLLLSGETCDDPHIERMIQSFALLAGRIHRKLDDEYPEFTEALLQVAFPQFLRPFPSVSIAHFDAGAGADRTAAPLSIPRHTQLHTRPVKGVSCRFRTAYEVDLLPVHIARVEFEQVVDGTGLSADVAASSVAAIRIRLEGQPDSPDLQSLCGKPLRLFLNGEPGVVAAVRIALFGHLKGIWVSDPDSSAIAELPASALQPVGFQEHEALLDDDVRFHRAYQLLLEYFAFPEKFNFIDIDLRRAIARLPAGKRQIDIRFGLAKGIGQDAQAHLLDRLGKENFLLACTPVVNLFSRNAEPIRVTETTTTYPVIIDNRHPDAYEVFELRRVCRLHGDSRSDKAEDFRPFYSIRHGEAHDGPARYWHASYPANRSDFMEITLVDSDLEPDRIGHSTLSIDVSCSNRDLPSQLPFGLMDGDLFAEGDLPVKLVRLLRRPTPSYCFQKGRGAQWRFISQLSLNHFSLDGKGLDALKEILVLYDVSGSAINRHQIDGLVGIVHRGAVTRLPGNPFPVMVRGIEIRLTVDETHYAGIGLFMFAQILDRFFGLYIHTNSFTRLTIISRQTGKELIKCPPRCGDLAPV